MQHTQTASCSRQVCWLPLSSITPRVDHAFGQEESRSIMELTASIQRWGLQRPITVQPQGPGRYVIVSGNRRYVACRMAGFTHMDAIVLPAAGAGCTDQELLRCLGSGQMHYLEEADTCHRLLEDGMTREQLARCLGKTPAQISQKLRLTVLDEDLRRYLVEQNLSEGYARALSKLPDPAGRMAIARQAVAQRLYVRDVELLVTAAIARLPVPPPHGWANDLPDARPSPISQRHSSDHSPDAGGRSRPRGSPNSLRRLRRADHPRTREEETGRVICGENAGGEAASLREAPLPQTPSPEERLAFGVRLSFCLVPPEGWARFPAGWLWSRRLTELPRPCEVAAGRRGGRIMQKNEKFFEKKD